MARRPKIMSFPGTNKGRFEEKDLKSYKPIVCGEAAVVEHAQRQTPMARISSRMLLTSATMATCK